MHRSPILLALLASLTLGGCKTPYKESDEKRKKDKHDFSGEPSFQAFVGRLQIAVAKRDYEMLQSLMDADFGYRWDAPPPGDSVFAYWSLNNLWPELSAILKTPFAPKDSYLVAPPAFVVDPNYAGYRVGIRQVNGSWKFGYFLPPPPPSDAPQ